MSTRVYAQYTYTNQVIFMLESKSDQTPKNPNTTKTLKKPHRFDFTSCEGELETIKQELSGIWFLNFY